MAKKVGIDEVEKIIGQLCIDNPQIAANTDVVVGISRGGLIPAALLAARIQKPLIAVYIDRKDRIFFDRCDWIAGKKVLVVDDVVRSGKTACLVRDHLLGNAEPAELDFFALYRVVKLAQPGFRINVRSLDSGQDVVFPWDC